MAVQGRTGIFPHRIDRTTDANTSIDYAHKEIHSGDAFYLTATEKIDAAGTLERCLSTPNTTKWGHLLFAIEAQSEVTFEIYEGVTINDLSYPVFNHNRNSANANTITAWNLLDVGAATLIWSWISGGIAATPSRGSIPSIARAEEEIILKQATEYLFRITSTANDNNVNMFLTWYEHTNVE